MKPNNSKGKGNDRAAVIAELFSMYPTKRYTLKSLAAASGGADRDGRHHTALIVEQMIEAGAVRALGSGKYGLDPSARQAMEGVVDMQASGAAYIRVEGRDQDIYIAPRATRHALNGDRVRFAITRTRKGGAPEGEIIAVVERSDRKYVGVIELDPSHHYGFVRVDSRKMPVDVFVHLDKETGVRDGQKVVVAVTDWPETAKNPQGRIVDILGTAGDNDTEMHAILAEYDLPYRFEPRVVEEAEHIPGQITKKDHAERRDMRDTVTFTIDPADAKDFDDALSIRPAGEGVWEVGVHIADVTHYVRPGTVVDTEAENRATSVYLVDRTVPMLPERLSNELCSLRPDEEKLTFSAVFEIDSEANVLKEWFGRTVIRSDRRFAYEEAQAVIETGEGDMKDEILMLNTLAQKMRERRFKNGAISFDREEAKFVLDPDGKPTGVYFKVQKEANQLIEEFMLLANRRVAEFVGKKHGGKGVSNRTMVYRVHDEPNADKLANFKKFIVRFGYRFTADEGKAVSREMNRLMAKIKGTYEENVISTLAIRTMAKAYYSTDNIGHYGLAFPYYTHFTSPIRRYPDMMVHRLLALYLDGGKSPDKNTCEQRCEHSSEMEVRASEAERASIKYKMVEFMVDRRGEEFDGHISGITEWGIYVELDDTHIEGMVSLRDMTDDFYDFDEENYAVVGRAAGRVFTLGDAVRIRVLRADLARKQLDFLLVASYDFHTKAAIPVAETAQGIYGRSYSTRGNGGRGNKQGKSRGGKHETRQENAWSRKTKVGRR